MIIELLALAAAAGGQDGAWRLAMRNDPVQDTAEIYALIGSQRRHVAIGCDKGVSSQPHLVIRVGEHLGSATRGILMGGRDITIRFDDRQPLVWRAEYEDDGVVEDQQRYVRQVIEQVRTSRKMVIRAINYDDQEVDLVFAYGDPAPVIDRALALCASMPVSSERG